MMRSIPKRLLLTATAMVAFTIVPVAADAGSSSVAKFASLKLCTYNTGDVNEGSQALIVKVVASGGVGVKGTLRVTGSGLKRTVPFKLKKGGIGLVALPLTPPIALTLTTTLNTKPAKHTRTDHVTFAPTNANPTTASRGCVAR